MSSFWLDNVRFDGAIVDEPGGFAHTESIQAAVEVRDGVIAAITSTAPADSEVIDGGGLLLLPPLRDLHIHVDKTYYGGPWRAPALARSLADRIDQEVALLPELVSHLEERAAAIVGLVASRGTSFLRVHTNVDHVVGAESVGRLAALAPSLDQLAHLEIVAFPQHGLQDGRMVPVLRDAIQAGASIIGGIDPARTETNIDKALEATFELATAYGIGIDIHLHDPGTLGTFQMRRIAAFTEDAGLHGRVTISHAYALAQVDESTAAGTAEELAAAGVDVTTALQLDAAIPVPLMRRLGVRISVGTDSVMDHWDPFGSGDMLEKASLIAQRFGCLDERSLAAALTLATGGVPAVDPDGAPWLRVGDSADFLLIDASCASEAVARRPRTRRSFRRGVEAPGVP
ncbi:amidohydrolase family protein [Nocardioides sp.]|uniref:amidohydrolase family protein n=1 Tax=Nocardioides sp. TaxID=35761 RepID=UPI00260D337A|nr:amidohydrolase family protein [Nocardioides sp.]MDI6908577.1 amidohydrolase family protein [Nocardioides sp.]